MGKGGGCVPSKKKFPNQSTAAAAAEDEHELLESTPTEIAADESSAAAIPPRNLRLFIVYYSMYGHVEGLARRMKQGVDSFAGVEAELYRVPETLTEDVLAKMQAPPKDDSIPEIGSPADLAAADGFLFGFPTRYGSMAAQMKAFFDSTAQLWKEQKLAGKPAGFFVSTGTQGGGQETTAWTAITQLAHHGMLFVPIGYTFGAGMFRMDSIRGGTPYGAGVFAGDGTREPSETELALAEHQGNYMAGIVKRLANP
ncbi:probable NAD(P)H dehydrogenase (quinone) FQR1-like 2 [Salvia splendens]|uniref:probable NAD(P)H dehydrogenase (quinone) FQR1-like 2 n=1 Tax=Salvia splendens TaxID=180675 RepID=UPI001C26D607|nr:probable NAD(P)H dehydrogenase (quinone) FQR1-like 2 [Salvia splendens]XP_042017657.1 probable NAD(P)H dehydrogenase (quinone) FQR1-like 2 [Salvia splendens]